MRSSPEFAGSIPAESMDKEFIHDILDKLTIDAWHKLRQDEAEAMRVIMSGLAVSENLEFELKRNPAFTLFLDQDFFNPEVYPDMLTSSTLSRRIVYNDGRLRDAVEVLKQGGPEARTSEKRAILTMWSIFFESYNVIAKNKLSIVK
jgi:hypothetical protein